MFKYCKQSVKRVKGCEPKHPLYCRTYEQNGEFVQANSFEDTPFDVVISSVAPSVAEQLKAGETPQKIHAVSSVNGLDEQRVAQQFVSLFKAFGRRSAPAASAEPVAPVAPAAPVAPVEPVEPSK